MLSSKLIDNESSKSIDNESSKSIDNESSELTIDNLPCELLVCIFKEFDLMDLFELRLVCKKFATIIKNEIKLKELNLFNFKRSSLASNYWFYLNRSCNHKYNFIYYKNDYLINYLRSGLFKNLFNNLKYFKLDFYSTELSKFDLTFLNDLVNLIHIEIFVLKLDDDNLILNFSNITTLALYFVEFYRSDYNLIVNCKRLQNFKSSCKLSKIKIENIDTIKFLEVEQFSNEELTIENLECINNFKNLEILNCEMCNQIDLELLSNLKELNFYYNPFNPFDVSFDSAKKILIKLIDKKSKLKRLDLEINIIYTVISFSKQLKIIDFNQTNHQIKFDNYSVRVELKKLEYIYFERNKYNYLINQLDHNLILKLNNIRSLVFANLEKVDQNLIINLISKFNKLRNLTIISKLFNQQFYNQLPIICPYLNLLEISSCRLKIDLNVFVSKLNYLIKIVTNQKLNFDSIVDWFKSNKNLHHIDKNRKRYKNYEIIRIDKNEFELYLGKNNVKHILKINELKSKLLSI